MRAEPWMNKDERSPEQKREQLMRYLKDRRDDLEKQLRQVQHQIDTLGDTVR